MNALNVEADQNINTIAANLSARAEFTSVPTDTGQTPSQMGAKYFSCEYSGTYFSANGVTNGSLFGYIWNGNGTLILCYSAVIDPITLQVLEVNVYSPQSCPPPNETSPDPLMSDYTCYTIEGSPSLSSTTVQNVENSIVPDISNNISTNNWAGYEFYYGDNQLLSDVDANTLNVPTLSDGNVWGWYEAISTWVGASATAGADNSVLYQAGWEGVKAWPALGFSYYAWVEEYPINDQEQLNMPVGPGSLIDVSIVTVSNEAIQVQVADNDQYWLSVEYIYNSTTAPRFGQFIAETPTSSFWGLATLPSWSGDIFQWDPELAYAIGNQQYGNYGSYFISANQYNFYYINRGAGSEISTSYGTTGTDEYEQFQYVTSH